MFPLFVVRQDSPGLCWVASLRISMRELSIPEHKQHALTEYSQAALRFVKGHIQLDLNHANGYVRKAHFLSWLCHGGNNVLKLFRACLLIEVFTQPQAFTEAPAGSRPASGSRPLWLLEQSAVPLQEAPGRAQSGMLGKRIVV